MARDLLKTGSDWLADQLKTHAATTVTYWRGTESVELAATIGRSEWEVETADGVVEKIESRDFLCHAADLALAGAPVTPEPGDLIRETDGAVTRVYEVLAPAGAPAWRYSDPYRKLIRVHTKRGRPDE